MPPPPPPTLKDPQENGVVSTTPERSDALPVAVPAHNTHLDDGWTNVGRSKKTCKSQKLNPLTLNHVDTAQTLEAIQKDFDTKSDVWRNSQTRTLYLQRLDRSRPDNGWPITKAVCFASGSFSRVNLTSRNRSLFQFVAFLDIVRHVGNSTATAQPIKVFAQDPMYTDTDRAFLTHLDIDILELQIDNHSSLGPAEQHLGPQTMIAELCMDMSADHVRALLSSDTPLYAFASFASMARQILAENVQTMPYGYKSRAPKPKSGSDSGDAQLLIDFHEHYDTFELARFEDNPYAFCTFGVHVKRLVDEDES